MHGGQRRSTVRRSYGEREMEGEDVHSDGELTRKVMPWTARKKRDGDGGEELGEARPLPERKKRAGTISGAPPRFRAWGGSRGRGGADGGFSSRSGGRR